MTTSDVSFENEVSAMKFAKTNVDQISSHTTAIKVDADGEKSGIFRHKEV